MKPIIIKIPGLGRFAIVPDKDGSADYPGGLAFRTNLKADLFEQGKWQGSRDLGSGLVTHVGVQAIANDWNWASPSAAAINTIKLSNFHASGTGATAAANTDIQLQTATTTIATPVVAGAQTLIVSTAAANAVKYQTVATILYDASGPYVITEWGVFTASTLSATTGTPFTAGSATTGTVTGTPLTASSSTVQGQQQFIFRDTTAATQFYGLVTSNSTSTITVPAWYTVGTGAVSGLNPVNADAYQIRPVMLDHKVFSAINVSNGDSIQFTYQLTISSNG